MVNKNEISGLIAMQGCSSDVTTRPVTIVLTYPENGVDVKLSCVLTPRFVTGKAFYSLTDIPDGIKSISAKTSWHLRRKIAVTPASGQSTANFTGSKELLGGDLATPGFPKGDNAVNALDYAVLRSAWGYGSAGDITADGLSDNSDYLIMQSNWYKTGDSE